MRSRRFAQTISTVRGSYLVHLVQHFSLWTRETRIDLTFWFVPDKNTVRRVLVWWQPFSQHEHWHADSHLLVCCIVLFTRRCQTNLSGVPSLGQRWECIKSVKMATVTSSWHSLHLVMMSKYDVPPICPEIIISPLKSATGPLQLPLMNITPHPAASFAIYTRLWSLQSLLSLLFFTWTHRFSLSPVHQPSLLFCSHSPAILHLPFTLNSLSPLL